MRQSWMSLISRHVTLSRQQIDCSLHSFLLLKDPDFQCKRFSPKATQFALAFAHVEIIVGDAVGEDLDEIAQDTGTERGIVV